MSCIPTNDQRSSVQVNAVLTQGVALPTQSIQSRTSPSSRKLTLVTSVMVRLAHRPSLRLPSDLQSIFDANSIPDKPVALDH